MLTRKMEYIYCSSIMESRVGSISPGLRCSPTTRQQTWKRSSFCPNSSTKLTQSIIKDHMLSHYKKVYSAKAAIDASVPKSLIHSVKYNDQFRQEHLRKRGRPQSAHSFSQRNCRASCSSAEGTFYDHSPYLFSRSSTVSSPRFGTSFHTKDIVYPSCKVGSQSPFHHARPASEIKYRSPDMTPQRKQSACSLSVSRDQSCYKTFQDPGQKTYSGDLLKKHSQHFTQDKPFTPKTLKSDKSSYLSKYRYYRAPQRNSTQSRLMHQEQYHGSTKAKDCTREFYEPSQGLNTEHEWSDEEFNGTYLESGQQNVAIKSRDSNLFDSSSRVSPGGGDYSTMKNVAAEEEELIYLEFISAVTEDILSRGHISDRVIDRVMKRHIDMNRNHLDEDKMHHLLEVLRKDFQEPTNTSTCHADHDRKDDALLDAFLPHLESGGRRAKTKANNDLLPDASLVESFKSTDPADPLLASTPVSSFDRTSSPTTTNEREREDGNLEKGISSPCVGDRLSYDEGVGEDDLHQNQTGTNTTNGNENHECASMTSDKGFHRDQIELINDEQSKELDDLGRCLSQTLHVSSNTHHNDVETSEGQTDAVASASDDEF